MCGFVCLISDHVTKEQLDLGIRKKIAHRCGYDGTGFWISPNKNMGMAHRRLHTTGESQITQPYRNETNSIVSCVNGQFYNYKQLKKQLITKVISFKQTLIVNCYLIYMKSIKQICFLF